MTKYNKYELRNRIRKLPIELQEYIFVFCCSNKYYYDLLKEYFLLVLHHIFPCTYYNDVIYKVYIENVKLFHRNYPGILQAYKESLLYCKFFSCQQNNHHKISRLDMFLYENIFSPNTRSLAQHLTIALPFKNYKTAPEVYCPLFKHLKLSLVNEKIGFIGFSGNIKNISYRYCDIMPYTDKMIKPWVSKFVVISGPLMYKNMKTNVTHFSLLNPIVADILVQLSKCQGTDEVNGWFWNGFQLFTTAYIADWNVVQNIHHTEIMLEPVWKTRSSYWANNSDI